MIKRGIILLLLLALGLVGQTAKFPAAIASDQDLLVACANSSSVLTAALDSSSLTVQVASSTSFCVNQMIQIDEERMQVCSKGTGTLTLCTGTRGFDETVAATHLINKSVRGQVGRYHHNVLREEVQAIETALGANLENIGTAGNAVTQSVEFDTEGAIPVAAAASGRATIQSGWKVNPSTGALESASTSPTTITGKHQTGTIAEPSAGLTNFGFDMTTGIPVYRVNGGSELSLASLSGTETLTNKTLDAEGTGNAITLTSKAWLEAAGCQNATAGLMWDTPTSNPAVAACVTGTNTQKGVAAFADGASLSIQRTLALPADWTGAIDARFKWSTSGTSGSVVWQIATSCVADAETDDPSWNAASTVTDAAKGTANQTNDAAITGITATGCAAGELLHVKVLRDASHASDDLAATANLIGVELTIRRTM